MPDMHAIAAFARSDDPLADAIEARRDREAQVLAAATLDPLDALSPGEDLLDVLADAGLAVPRQQVRCGAIGE